MSRARGRGYRSLQDAQLVALVSERDGGALEALYDRYGKAVYSLARGIVADELLAQGIVREVFLSLWRGAGWSAPARRPVAAHLLFLTRQRAVDAGRREGRLRRGGSWDDGDGLTGEAGGAGEAGGGPGAGGAAELAGPQRRVRQALMGLPEAQRRALALAFLGGYTQREVAALIGAAPDTVTTHMAAGMRALKAALVDGGHGEREARHPWWTRR